VNTPTLILGIIWSFKYSFLLRFSHRLSKVRIVCTGCRLDINKVIKVQRKAEAPRFTRALAVVLLQVHWGISLNPNARKLIRTTAFAEGFGRLREVAVVGPLLHPIRHFSLDRTRIPAVAMRSQCLTPNLAKQRLIPRLDAHPWGLWKLALKHT
jgi:hypothetical protein